MFVDNSYVDVALRGLVLSTLGIAWVVILVRVNGLRSFSKMTNFDFVMTVAVGSLLAGAGQATSWTAFEQIVVAMATLFFVQYLTAKIRKRSKFVESLLQSQPVVLMREGEFIEAALQQSRVAKSDVIAKLREANVLDLSEVRAVILETTGDVSVLHGDRCAEEVLQGTRDID
ncbi:MAG: YetF domain-containing protein [Planctomycetota bacterium]